MKRELFEQLTESVRDGGAILRGRLRPSRIFRAEELATGKSSAPDHDQYPEAVFDVVTTASGDHG